MNARDTNIDDMLTRILSHRATKEEITRFAAWVRKAGNRERFDKFKKAWHLTSGGHATPEEIESGLRRYQEFIASSLRKRLYRRIAKGFVSTAAVVLVGLFAGHQLTRENTSDAPFQAHKPQYAQGVILTLGDGSKINISQRDSFCMATSREESVFVSKTGHRNLIYTADPSNGTREEERSYNQVVVPAGMRFNVQLSDGTKVWLNSESSLRYPTRFGTGRREVEVQGNAYFEVTKDSMHPFIVNAPQLTTEVLGTSFEVDTYGDHNALSVTLVEGSVKVHSPIRTSVISPDEQFIYDMEEKKAAVVLVDAAEKVRWKDGILCIKNESFEDVVWKLERWYGVNIENATGKTFSQLFSGEFDEEDIQVAMQVLCTHLNITYSMEKDKIILRSK